MLYKFLHKDGYEATIKDIDTFIEYVNDNKISKETVILMRLLQKPRQPRKLRNLKKYLPLWDKMDGLYMLCKTG